MSLKIQQLSPIGAEIIDPDVDELLQSPSAPSEFLDALDASGVVIARGLHLDDATQLEFARRLGEIVVRQSPGWSSEFPGIYRIALDPDANDEFYVKGSWDWHFDGATSHGTPPKGSMLTCWTASGTGGETEFVSTYVAYELLTPDEREQLAQMKVCHELREEAYSVPINMSDAMRERLAAEPSQLHPLVWKHRDGRKSLVLGVTASYIEGLPVEEGRELLQDLLDRATQRSQVLSHSWDVGDFVMWDNQGTLHRARPYDGASGRDMHRTTLVGHEPIE